MGQVSINSFKKWLFIFYVYRGIHLVFSEESLYSRKLINLLFSTSKCPRACLTKSCNCFESVNLILKTVEINLKVAIDPNWSYLFIRRGLDLSHLENHISWFQMTVSSLYLMNVTDSHLGSRHSKLRKPEVTNFKFNLMVNHTIKNLKLSIYDMMTVQQC